MKREGTDLFHKTSYIKIIFKLGTCVAVINIFKMKIAKEFHFEDKKFRRCMVGMVTQQWYCT